MRTRFTTFLGRPKQRSPERLGGSLGGPITIPKVYDGRDRTFFYMAYERYKESYAGAGSPAVTVPWTSFGRHLAVSDDDVIGQDILGLIYRGAIYDPASTKIVNADGARPFPETSFHKTHLGPAKN